MNKKSGHIGCSVQGAKVPATDERRHNGKLHLVEPSNPKTSNVWLSLVRTWTLHCSTFWGDPSKNLHPKSQKPHAKPKKEIPWRFQGS